MMDNRRIGKGRKKIPGMTIIGMLIFIAAMLLLLFSPESLNGAFEAMVERAHPIVVDVGLLSKLGVSIVIGVVMGRIMERLGFTDALMFILIPIGRALRCSPTVLIPSIYNLLGDVNAASKIAGPILIKSGATNDEKKLAIFTLVQAHQSFSTLMLGLGALTLAGARVALVVLISIFVPMFLAPLIGRTILYRDCSFTDVDEMPVFTPKTPFVNTLFDAGQEGMSVLLLLILPAFAVVFSVIGLLSYLGVWAYIESGITAMLTWMNIDPSTGLLSIMASPTLAVSMLKDMAAGMEPRVVIGSFVLAASGFPLSCIFGQLPMIWSSGCEMKASDVIQATVTGVIFRILTAGFIATVLGGLLVK